MTTFSDLLLHTCEEVPQKTALTIQHAGQDDQSFTYADLLAGANDFGAACSAAGIKPGEVLILILPHGKELVFAFWGAVLYGVVPSILPVLTEKLSPEHYRADLASLIAITKPVAIMTCAGFEPEVRAALRQGDSVRVVLLSEEVRPAPVPEHFAGLKRSPDEVVLLQHSSGSTGLQKGVALSHGAVLNQLDAYRNAIALDSEKDVIVSWLPLYHDMGLIACFILPLLLRVQLVLMSPLDWVRAPHRLLQAVSQYKGTLSWLPNFAYNFCAQKIRERSLTGLDLSSWRLLINCSEPVHPESHAMFYEKFAPYGLPATALQTCYAMAENTFAVAQSRLPDGPARLSVDRETFLAGRSVCPPVAGRPALQLMSSGRPLENVRVRVVDPQGADYPDGQVGEIILKSDCMLNEYYHRPEITKKVLVDGWFSTGDFGFFMDGDLYVSGRKKDIIIVGGKNIYPQDLEALASEIPGVHPGRVVAFGLDSDESGTEEVVLIVEAESAELDEQQRISDLVRQHVTRNSAVSLRYVQVVPPKWILKTSSGKTARSANKEKYLQSLGNPDQS